VLAVRLVKRDAPPRTATVVAAAGSFAAVSTLLGSPLLGAFLLMEASGLGGPMLGVVLVPGLLASGVGALIFVGLDSLTGLGTFSLAIPSLPPFGHPDLAEFGWAIVIGLAAALLGPAILWLSMSPRSSPIRFFPGDFSSAALSTTSPPDRAYCPPALLRPENSV